MKRLESGMPDLPVIVSGVGRCGTSMVMAMLEAGGFPVKGEAPLYEQPLDRFDKVKAELAAAEHWYNPLDGAATKMLFPYLSHLHSERAYKFIWLVRDPLQQAASQAKFAFATRGEQSDRAALRKMAGANMALGIEGLKKCREGFGDGSMCYSRRFEWCLAQPEALARDLMAFIGFEADLDAMVAVVRERPGECANEMEFQAVGS